MKTRTEFLSRVPLFSSMHQKDVERLAVKVRSKVFNHGVTIIREGENDTRLFMIIEGEVDVIKNLGESTERHMRTLGPPAYFGEMALIDGMVRSATVVARTDAKVLFLDRVNLMREIERTPAMAMELIRMMSTRIRAIEKCLIEAVGDCLPICLHCSRVHEKRSGWVAITKYIEAHADCDLTQSICPECSKERFPQFYE